MTQDTDVSGSTAPQDRDDLGPWLTDRAKLAQLDILCVAKLDRLTRSVRHFDDLRIWADKHGKTIASVAESLDLSTSTGRMFANLPRDVRPVRAREDVRTARGGTQEALLARRVQRRQQPPVGIQDHPAKRAVGT